MCCELRKAAVTAFILLDKVAPPPQVGGGN